MLLIAPSWLGVWCSRCRYPKRNHRAVDFQVKPSRNVFCNVGDYTPKYQRRSMLKARFSEDGRNSGSLKNVSFEFMRVYNFDGNTNDPRLSRFTIQKKEKSFLSNRASSASSVSDLSVISLPSPPPLSKLKIARVTELCSSSPVFFPVRALLREI